MEKIEVRYTLLGVINGENYYHKYLVYTDASGNRRGARGGPSAGSGTISELISAQSGVLTGGTVDSPFGNIDTIDGAYVPSVGDVQGFPDFD